MNLNSKARRLARANGYILRKSRRAISAENLGGYMVVDLSGNFVVAGSQFDLEAGDVIAFLNTRSPTDQATR